MGGTDQNHAVRFGVLVLVFTCVACSASTGPTGNASATSTDASGTHSSGAGASPIHIPKGTPLCVAHPDDPACTPEDTGPAKSYETFGDGTFRIGKDIKPGTYRTRQGSGGCYWERLKGFGGNLNDVLANELTDAPAVVTILKGDKGFQTSGCADWTSDLSKITDSKTKFGDGTFIVGTDITPGTYRAPGGDACYWSRLKGFTGDLGDVIANDLPSGSTLITIAKTDEGFSTSGCGTWKRV
jgi:hypothetical protein